MWPYLFVTLAIVVASALLPRPSQQRLAWMAGFIVLVLFTGLRHKVGMDWNNYLAMARQVGGESLWQALGRAEPGYALLLWTSVKAGFGVYGANLVGATVFCAGLFRCAKATDAPWLALAVAMPMLVVVVSMSANRQTIAIGVLLWLVGSWGTLSLWQRVAITTLASLFHYSAILFLFFAALDMKLKPAYRVAVGSVMAIASILFMQYSGAIATYDQFYIGGQTAATYSPGAIQHVLFNGLPAALAFAMTRRTQTLLPTALLRRMAILSIALIPLALFYSTAAGRMTMYMFPVSMFVLTGLVRSLSGASARAFGTVSIGLFMSAILAYWLSFSNSGHAYMPYSNALTEETYNLAL